MVLAQFFFNLLNLVIGKVLAITNIIEYLYTSHTKIISPTSAKRIAETPLAVNSMFANTGSRYLFYRDVGNPNFSPNLGELKRDSVNV